MKSENFTHKREKIAVNSNKKKFKLLEKAQHAHDIFYTKV